MHLRFYEIQSYICKTSYWRTATANFWQSRPPHQRRAAAAAAATTDFYSAKCRQGLGLGGLASRGGPAL
jgi:hypothetical protein